MRTQSLRFVLAHIVANRLRLQRSPQQVAGWLKHVRLGNDNHHVSHETIYHSRFILAGGRCAKELTSEKRIYSLH